jgi:hypothetical protein
MTQRFERTTQSAKKAKVGPDGAAAQQVSHTVKVDAYVSFPTEKLDLQKFMSASVLRCAIRHFCGHTLSEGTEMCVAALYRSCIAYRANSKRNDGDQRGVGQTVAESVQEQPENSQYTLFGVVVHFGTLHK